MAIGLACDGEQRADAAIVFASDGNYLRYAASRPRRSLALAAGAATSTSASAPADAAPVRGPRRTSASGSAGSTTGGAFARLGLDPRRTEAAYLRLALPAAFAGAYRRLLYLDADVFVQGGDFGALLGVDIGPHALAAVRDNIQWRTPGRRPDAFRRLGLGPAPFFNSGVLLIDVAAFNAQDVLARCLAFGAGTRRRGSGSTRTC